MLIVIVVVFLLTSNFYLNFSLYFIISNLIVRSVNIRIVSNVSNVCNVKCFFFVVFLDVINVSNFKICQWAAKKKKKKKKISNMKNKIYIMTQAWEKENILVPDGNRAQLATQTPEVMGSIPLRTQIFLCPTLVTW